MKIKERTFPGSLSTEVTPMELEHGRLARAAAAEGFVLLKNEGGALPLKKNSKLGLYGAGAVRTIKGGTGSGDVNERHSVTIREGLENAGLELTSSAWLDSYETVYTDSRLAWRDEIIKSLPEYDNNFFNAYSTHPYFIPAGRAIDGDVAENDGADTAVYVLSRIAGENKDRLNEAGDYLITDAELEQLRTISRAYAKVVLVINTGGLIDLSFADDFANISAIIQYVQAGQEGGNALADILTGAVTPSGKLTDSWAYRYDDYPNADTFSYHSGNVFREDYKEGIYVGYRYFDTFDVPVRYSFGFGLSYTSFEMTAGAPALTGLGTAAAGVSVEVTVKNTGSFSGKEVAELYAACPQEGLPKEFRRLAAFAKTKLLAPGEAQVLTLSFPLYGLASYDEAEAAWTLEKGLYGLFLGSSLANASLFASLSLDETKVLTRCKNILVRKEELTELQPDASKLAEKTAAWKAAAASLPSAEIAAKDLVTEVIDYEKKPERSKEAREIVAKMTEDQLIAMATGDIASSQEGLGAAGQIVPGAASETPHVAEALGVASIALADGPAGLRLRREYEVKDGKLLMGGALAALEGGFFEPAREPEGDVMHQYCTAYPVGTLLAQTWNTGLLKEVGKQIGEELERYGVTLWLAPGMNIHRNPLCGRNFEYYSEDPGLAGSMAAAVTEGLQSIPGVGTTVKHFAGNNQEDNRMGSDDIVSERAFREIYLKGFEIAVKTAQPMSIMTSYNMINGIHAANSYDLCTNAARREWGFRGAIMTDWVTTFASTAGICTASGCMRAGNDMVMPGAPVDHENLRKELAEGTLTLDEIRECVTATVDLILKSNRYE